MKSDPTEVQPRSLPRVGFSFALETFPTGSFVICVVLFLNYPLTVFFRRFVLLFEIRAIVAEIRLFHVDLVGLPRP